MSISDMALNELVTGIVAALDNCALRIVLYGSVARGTDVPGSDIDIAVIIRAPIDTAAEERLSDFVVEMNLKYDRVFSVIDINNSVYEELSNISPFYRNLKNEGIILWKAA